MLAVQQLLCNDGRQTPKHMGPGIYHHRLQRHIQAVGRVDEKSMSSLYAIYSKAAQWPWKVRCHQARMLHSLVSHGHPLLRAPSALCPRLVRSLDFEQLTANAVRRQGTRLVAKAAA